MWWLQIVGWCHLNKKSWCCVVVSLSQIHAFLQRFYLPMDNNMTPVRVLNISILKFTPYRRSSRNPIVTRLSLSSDPLIFRKVANFSVHQIYAKTTRYYWITFVTCILVSRLTKLFDYFLRFWHKSYARKIRICMPKIPIPAYIMLVFNVPDNSQMRF